MYDGTVSTAGVEPETTAISTFFTLTLLIKRYKTLIMVSALSDREVEFTQFFGSICFDVIEGAK